MRDCLQWHMAMHLSRRILSQGTEGLEYDAQLLFNWNNVFWGSNLLLAQLSVRTIARPGLGQSPIAASMLQ